MAECMAKDINATSNSALTIAKILQASNLNAFLTTFLMMATFYDQEFFNTQI